MSDSRTFDCPACGNVFMILGNEYVVQRFDGPLQNTGFKMEFDVVVQSCTCTCGAMYQSGTQGKQWRRRIERKDGTHGYETYAERSGDWHETMADRQQAEKENAREAEQRKANERKTRGNKR